MRVLQCPSPVTGHFTRRFVPADLERQIDVYIDCFRGPPWYEVFERDEVREHFERVLAYPETIFSAALLGSEIVGGGIGWAVKRHPKIMELIDEKWHDAFYVDELYVQETVRRHGFALRLTYDLLVGASGQGFKKFVLRTSVDQPIIQHIFMCKIGGTIQAVQKVTSRKVINGSEVIAPDRRVVIVGEMPSLRPAQVRLADYDPMYTGCFR